MNEVVSQQIGIVGFCHCWDFEFLCVRDHGIVFQVTIVIGSYKVVVKGFVAQVGCQEFRECFFGRFVRGVRADDCDGMDVLVTGGGEGDAVIVGHLGECFVLPIRQCQPFGRVTFSGRAHFYYIQCG